MQIGRAPKRGSIGVCVGLFSCRLKKDERTKIYKHQHSLLRERMLYSILQYSILGSSIFNAQNTKLDPAVQIRLIHSGGGRGERKRASFLLIEKEK